MEWLEEYLDQIFALEPPGNTQKERREQARQQLLDWYHKNQEQGMPWEKAVCNAMIAYLQHESAHDREVRQGMEFSYQRFRKAFPWLIRCSFLSVVIVPLLIFLPFPNSPFKLNALAVWVTCVIAAVTFVILVEYMDYRFHRKLHPEDYREISLPEEEVLEIEEITDTEEDRGEPEEPLLAEDNPSPKPFSEEKAAELQEEQHEMYP